MKLLVDAHIGQLIIGLLERLGHDIMRASSFPPKTSDEEILNVAARESRVVVTSDKDFGELIFRQRQPAAGVILLRISARTEAERLAVFERFWPRIEPVVAGHFVVVTSKNVRRSPLPFGPSAGEY
jgi:predicted nuclease of predicted toxin-antitoxin system